MNNNNNDNNNIKNARDQMTRGNNQRPNIHHNSVSNDKPQRKEEIQPRRREEIQPRRREEVQPRRREETQPRWRIAQEMKQ